MQKPNQVTNFQSYANPEFQNLKLKKLPNHQTLPTRPQRSHTAPSAHKARPQQNPNDQPGFENNPGHNHLQDCQSLLKAKPRWVITSKSKVRIVKEGILSKNPDKQTQK